MHIINVIAESKLGVHPHLLSLYFAFLKGQKMWHTFPCWHFPRCHPPPPFRFLFADLHLSYSCLHRTPLGHTFDSRPRCWRSFKRLCLKLLIQPVCETWDQSSVCPTHTDTHASNTYDDKANQTDARGHTYTCWTDLHYVLWFFFFNHWTNMPRKLYLHYIVFLH